MPHPNPMTPQEIRAAVGTRFPIVDGHEVIAWVRHDQTVPNGVTLKPSTRARTCQGCGAAIRRGQLHGAGFFASEHYCLDCLQDYPPHPIVMRLVDPATGAWTCRQIPAQAQHPLPPGPSNRTGLEQPQPPQPDRPNRERDRQWLNSQARV